jgi:hypothetical protein
VAVGVIVCSPPMGVGVVPGPCVGVVPGLPWGVGVVAVAMAVGVVPGVVDGVAEGVDPGEGLTPGDGLAAGEGLFETVGVAAVVAEADGVSGAVVGWPAGPSLLTWGTRLRSGSCAFEEVASTAA